MGGSGLAVLLFACLLKAPEPLAPTPAPTARDYVRPYKELLIEETTEIPSDLVDPGLPSELVVQQYRVQRTPTASGWHEEVARVTPEGAVVESAAEYFLDSTTGYGLSSWGVPGKEEVYTTPKLILPAQLNPTRWEGFHGTSRGTSRRLCQLSYESDFCEQAVAVTCQSWMPGEQIVVLREHFCRNAGWLGAEAQVFEQKGGECKVVLSSQFTLKAVEGVPVENVTNPTGWPAPLEGCLSEEAPQ